MGANTDVLEPKQQRMFGQKLLHVGFGGAFVSEEGVVGVEIFTCIVDAILYSLAQNCAGGFSSLLVLRCPSEEVPPLGNVRQSHHELNQRPDVRIIEVPKRSQRIQGLLDGSDIGGVELYEFREPLPAGHILHEPLGDVLDAQLLLDERAHLIWFAEL